MKKPAWASVVLAASFLGAAPSFAVPVTYNLSFDALLGPSGTGSFLYDDEAQLLTNLQWDFGSGIIGGFSFIPIPTPPNPLGGTASSFLAEMLTQTDLNPASNCIVTVTPTFCRSIRNGAIGLAPGNVPGVTFEVGSAFGTSVYYSFSTVTIPPFVPSVPPTPPTFGPSTANGYVTATLAVPEPSSMPLMVMAIFGFFVAMRRSRGYLS